MFRMFAPTSNLLDRSHVQLADGIDYMLILPVTALVTAILAYGVQLLVGGLFLNKFAKGIYGWTCIMGIVGAMAWLSVIWARIGTLLVAATAPRRWKEAA